MLSKNKNCQNCSAELLLLLPGDGCHPIHSCCYCKVGLDNPIDGCCCCMVGSDNPIDGCCCRTVGSDTPTYGCCCHMVMVDNPMGRCCCCKEDRCCHSMEEEEEHRDLAGQSYTVLVLSGFPLEYLLSFRRHQVEVPILSVQTVVINIFNIRWVWWQDFQQFLLNLFKTFR